MKSKQQIYTNFSKIKQTIHEPGLKRFIFNTKEHQIKFVKLSRGKNIALHKHDFDVFHYILKGKIKLVTKLKNFVLKENALIYLPKNSWHGFKSLSRTIMLEIGFNYKNNG